ncbi:hypothetical protein HYPSUDRAFT_67610 [Hypholoma sublateritium FD-334 SS-4]|uniref:Cytochrome P450 n=1 Tax=Hypholoma sublateritium (strain FD-334 SS-4) TaxID=945553 RepID=A0A0D2NSB1_HYPSF|nr:hypothetical protein HYPSUDRAFT_67610 [Hypholoma sublateritium FD-334 SS-4]
MALFDLVYLPYAWTVATAFLALLGWTLRSRLSQPKLPYPPGPPARSMISGNLADLPAKYAWHTYIEWGKKYGDIIHYRTFNKHTIVLNSYKDIVELLDKRSSIYADRPRLPMMDLMGLTDFNTGIMGYGPKWKFHRRILQQYFRADASLRYRAKQTRKVNDYLNSLLDTPDKFKHHIQTLAGAVIMTIMYDHDVAPTNDFFVDLAERHTVLLSTGIFPRSSLFQAFSILRFVPAWFPGAGFKRLCLESRKVAFDMRDIPMAAVQKQMKDGKTPDCVTANFLETCKSKEEFDAISGMASGAYGGRTMASLETFFQAITMYPEVQRRAQKEIDEVVGSKRLINYDDWSSLPYVEALLREVMRWRPVAPLSLAHSTTADDVYKGYYIPKETMILTNLWAIAHDLRRYSEPERFNPSRFIDENGRLNNDDVAYVFGFGRRICPGRHVASATIWLAMATVLQLFNIQKKKDSSGKEIEVDGGYTDAFAIEPLPFECTILPRSTESRQIISEAMAKAY